MLVSAILQVTSNSVFAFVFCNLIVLVILVGTEFGSTDYGTRDAMPVFGVHHDVKHAEIDVVERFSSDQIVRSSQPETQGEEKLGLPKVTEVCDDKIKREEENQDNIIEGKVENENKNENQEEEGEEVNDDEDDNGDDELRRRIEGFIALINREWDAENLNERMHQLTLLDSVDAPN